MDKVEVTIKLSQADYASLCVQAEDTCRTVEGMVAFLIRNFGAGVNTSIPPYQTFNPIKSEPTTNLFGSGSDDVAPKKVVLKKRKHKLLPDDAPQRVIMDGVIVRDPYDDKAVKVDRCKVFFYENKEGTAVLAQVKGRYLDFETGKPVESITFQTPQGMATQKSERLKLVNMEELVRRWQEGDYEVVDVPEDYDPRIVKVRNNRLVYKMADFEMGTFVPSPEQIKEYKERGWKQHQIDKFIEMRSSIIPGGPGYADWLMDTYAAIDAM